MEKLQELNIELLAIDNLDPYKNNPKEHPKHQIDDIANSISTFGFLIPVVIDQDGTVIAGHGRILAAAKLGMQEIPCIRVEHLSDDQVRAFRIADNKVAESDWIQEALKVEFDFLKDIDGGLGITGFTTVEIDDVYRAIDATTFLDPIANQQEEIDRRKPDVRDGEGTRYYNISFAVTKDQRSDILRGMKKARVRYEVNTSAEALVFMCRDLEGSIGSQETKKETGT